MACTNKVIGEADSRFVVIGCHDIWHGIHDALKQFKNHRASLLVLVQSLQNRPEIWRNGDLVSQAPWMRNASREALDSWNSHDFQDILVIAGYSVKDNRNPHEMLILQMLLVSRARGCRDGIVAYMTQS